MELIVNTIVTFAVSTICGFLLGRIKKSKEDDRIYKESLKCLLRANMVNTYFAYKEIGAIPYYCKQSWYLMYEEYRKLGGNSFIEDIKIEMDKFEIKK